MKDAPLMILAAVVVVFGVWQAAQKATAKIELDPARWTCTETKRRVISYKPFIENAECVAWKRLD